MNETTKTLNVGDYVLYRKGWGHKPVKTTVRKMSKAGWPSISLEPTGEGLVLDPAKFLQFKPVRWVSPTDLVEYELKGVGSRTFGQLASWSPEVTEKWEAEHAKAEETRKEKEADQAKRKAEREERTRTEMDAVADAIGTPWKAVTFQETLPDGSRLILLALPVKPDQVERKKGFERVLVRLHTSQDQRPWNEGKTVEMHLSYVNGSSGSFPSCSGEWFKSDDDALWEACRYVYHCW